MKKRSFGHGWLSRLVLVLLAAGWAALASGATITWTGSLDSDWFTTNNWSPAQVPVDGDAVVINSGTPLLTNATASLQSFTMNGGTLTCSNWSTRIAATDVWVLGSAQITLPPAFTNSPAMSNRVWIACTNFSLASGASISADNKGYAAVLNSPGNGPGGGTVSISGGGYGGRGGDHGAGGGLPYGLLEAPEAPGSAGASDNDYDGGNGGGAIRIEAPGGNVTVNGVVTANGGNTSGTPPYYGWNGSGGGVYITCRTFTGTNGAIMANAGRGAAYCYGGGGRIAVVYDPTAQAGMPKPSVLFSAARGSAGSMNILSTPQDIGTIYFPNAAVLNESWLPHTGQLWMASAAWNVNSLTLSNGWIRLPADGFKLTVTNSALITGASAKLELGGDQVSRLPYFGLYEFINCSTNAPTLTVGGNLVLTNGASLVVYSAPTNGASTNYGALVTVAGDVLVADTSWIYPHSNPTNGGAPMLRMNNLTVAGPGGGISADYRGYRKPYYENVYFTRHNGYGPGGGGKDYTGGGYGGTGSTLTAGYGGPTYGSSNAPIDPGSSGGIANSGDALGCNGGGAIRIEAAKTVTIKGTLSANGQNAYAYWGGGSGGGIYIRCKTFDGNATGSLQANGGTGASYGGGGGGGRIAVWRVNDLSGGAVPASVSVNTSLPIGGSPPSPGTVVWGFLPSAGTVIKAR